MSKKAFHPFLFALYPIMAFTVHNLNEVMYSGSVLLWLVYSLLGTAIIYCITIIIIKDTDKAALIATILILIFFSYGHLYHAIESSAENGFIFGRHRYLSPVYLVLLILAALFIVKVKKAFKQVTSVLNITSIIILVLPLLLFAVNRIQKIGQHPFVPHYEEPVKMATSGNGDRPDIYYIILDQYTDSTTLQNIYNFNNHEFLSFLRSQGCYVVENSYCNYGTTALSLSSSLNLDYLDSLGVQLGIWSNSRTYAAVDPMIKDNYIYRFLKENKYTIVNVSSWFGPTFNHPLANINYNGGMFDEFTFMFLRTTLLSLVEDNILAYDYRKRIVNSFSYLTNSTSIPGPKFIFAHIIAPHGPFVFGPQGESMPIVYDLSNAQRYLYQVQYVNYLIRGFISAVCQQATNKPIIILQGDHGPQASISKGQNDPQYIREKMSILNVFFYPDGDYSKLYTGITPINSFRITFNKYYKTEYFLKTDKNYLSEDIYTKRFTLKDVTHILNKAE